MFQRWCEWFNNGLLFVRILTYIKIFFFVKKNLCSMLNRRKNEKMWLEILFYLKMNLLVILVKFAQQQFLIALCDKNVKYVLQVISGFF